MWMQVTADTLRGGDPEFPDAAPDPDVRWFSSTRSLLVRFGGSKVQVMIRLSLLLNIVVLTPVCVGLITEASWIGESYGPSTAARSILLSVYLSIGLVSVLLLVIREPKLVAALLLVQVVYKLTTPMTVGTLFNPVVVSNLAIAAFHAVTLVLILRSGQQWAGQVGGSLSEDEDSTKENAT